jgi:hypothetical protein
MKDGFQIGATGADENCDTITFSGRREDWGIRGAKVSDEIACAKRFCSAEHPKLTLFTKMPTDSEVDVLAESPDKKEKSLKLQVAGLWPEGFLQRFGGQDVIDGKISREDLMDLIRASVQKKLKKKSSSQDVILLIDTKPADLRPQCLERIRSDEQLQQEIGAVGNFCEIWVVDSNGTVQLK